MQRRSAVRALLALIAAGGLALAALPLAAQDNQQIPLPLTFNEVEKSEITAIVIGEDVFVQPKDLEAAGVTGIMWKRLLGFARLRQGSHLMSGVNEFISLRSFAPLLTFKFDDANLTLSITATPELLTPTLLNVETGPPADIVYSKDNSTFLNYSLTSSGGSDRTSLFGESGTSIGGNLLYNSAARPDGGRLVRLVSSYTVDDRRRLNRWTFGDANVVSDALGGAALFGGATVSRNFNLDPYFIRYPPLNFRGTVLTPSRVEVYMNGTLVSQQDVPPGPFELRNIPASSGAGNQRIVIRDVFGNEQVSGMPYYYSTEVLAKNVSEFVYTAGFLRQDFGTHSFNYGDPAVLGFHRIGITNDFTAGGRFEASRSLVSGGPRATKRTRFGDFGVAIAASSDRGHSGAAGDFGYRYLARRFSFGGTAQIQSRQYANLSQRIETDRALVNSNLFATYLTRLASFTLVWDRAHMRDQPDNDRRMLLTNVPVTRRASLFLSVGEVDEGFGRKPQVFAGVSLFAGPTTTANFTIDHTNGRTETAVDVQKSIGIGTGMGYRLHANTNAGEKTGNASLLYQSDFGRYELRFNPFNTGERPSLTASGGVVFQKGAFIPARPVEESFALVRVPGVRNVRVYSSNMPVGRTDANGNLLVPNLLSYYGNRLRIDDRDVPLNYEVAATERTIAPPYRGGAFVQFPVRRITTITGRVAIRKNGTNVPPSYGQLTARVGSEEFESPLGKEGEFYLENIPAGSHPATIDYTDGSCSFVLTIPAGGEAVLKLGTVVCTEDKSS